MHRQAALTLVLLVLAPACSEVIVPEEASGGTSSSAGGAGGAGGEGGANVGGGTTGPGGGPSACTETHDTFELLLDTYDGHTYGCGDEAGNLDFSARVVEVQGTTLILDSCAPNADCPQLISKLSMTAPGMFLEVLPETYVRVQLMAQPFMGGCGQRVQIESLPVWGGVPNPAGPEQTLWALASDGNESLSPGSPVTIEYDALGCFPDEPPGCGDHDDYVFRFIPSDGLSSDSVKVPMGETRAWFATFPGTSQSMLVRNLRSFSAGYCDGPVDMAYWLVRATLTD